MTDDWMPWTVLIACQILMFVFAELGWRVGGHEPVLGYIDLAGWIPKLRGRPEMQVLVEAEDRSASSVAFRIVGIALVAGFVLSVPASQYLVFPGDTYHQVADIVKFGWFIFWLELYAADVWLCLWLWGRCRKRITSGSA